MTLVRNKILEILTKMMCYENCLYLSCHSPLLQSRQVRVAPRTSGPRRYRPQIFVESKVESLISLNRSTENLKCYLRFKYSEFNIFEARLPRRAIFVAKQFYIRPKSRLGPYVKLLFEIGTILTF